MSFRVAIFAVVGVEEDFTFSTSTEPSFLGIKWFNHKKVPTIKYNLWKELCQAEFYVVTVKHKMRFLSKYSD